MSFGAILANNLSYRILNILTLLLITTAFTRFASIEEFGLLTLMIVNASFFNLLTSLGIDSGITYNIATERLYRSKIIRLIFIFIIVQVLFAILIEWVSYILTGNFWILKHADWTHLWIGLVFIFSIMAIERFTALLNGMHQYIIPNKVSFICNLGLLLTLLIVFLSKEEQTVFHYLSVYVVFHFIQALVLGGIILKQNAPEQLNKSSQPLDMNILFSYSLVAFITNIIQFLAYRVDYWFLDYFRDQKEVGWYALSVRLVQLFWILPLFFAGIIFPKVAAQNTKDTQSQIIRIIRVVNWINITLGILSFFLAFWLIPFVFGNDFSKSVILFQILLPGIFLFSITNIIAAYFAGIGELSKNLIGSSLCLFIIFILDLLFIPRYGMTGAAIASSISYSITSIYFIFIFCKKLDINARDIFQFHKEDWIKVRSLITKS